MKIIHSRGALLTGLAIGLLMSHCLNAAERSNVNLAVMTFNLRYASSNKPNAWPDRRPVMRDCIRSIDPDLIGTQEGPLLPAQRDRD